MTLTTFFASTPAAGARHRPREWWFATAFALGLHAAWLVDGPTATAWRQAGPASPAGPRVAPLTVRRVDSVQPATTTWRAEEPERLRVPARAVQLHAAGPAGVVAPTAAAAATAERGAVADSADVPPAPSIDGDIPPPTYPTRLPPAFRRVYVLERGGVAGSAELSFATDADGYRLALRSHQPERPETALVSRGRLDAHGLAPERFAEARRGRERQAAHFDRAAATISYSGPQTRHPLLPGAQDRLSWLVQLPAVLAAEPSAWPAGRPIHLPVSGARGDAAVWTFVVQGRVEVASADGRVVAAVHLVREPVRPYDTRAEVWLDPADHHLPLRVHLTHPPAVGGLELRPAGGQGPDS